MAGAVCAAFAIGFLRVFRYQRSLRPTRAELLSGDVVLRQSVLVEVWLWPGYWSTKTQIGMQILVSTRGAWVNSRMDGVGSALGAEWCFFTDDTRIGWMHRLGHNWIVLAGRSGNRQAKIAIRSQGENDPIWDALIRVGFSVGLHEP